MKPAVELYDTTLRDGSQGEGVNFSVADKLRIAERIDAFGIHYIEGGWPGSNPKDIEFFAQAKRRKFKHAKLAAFGSTRKKATPVEQDDQVRLLIEAETPVVTIYGKTSMLHVKEVLRCTPDENLGMIGDTVRYLKDHGKYVIYDAEHGFDGYKLDPEYALATWQAAEQAGADMVVLCDTNGERAFAHKGGAHVNAVQKLASSYEHIDPALVGNERNILVSDLSGRSNILLKARDLGFKLADDAAETKAILNRVKELEHAGYEFEAAEASLALLIRSILDHNPDLLFTVDDYHVSMRGNRKSSTNEATVKVRVGKEVHHEVAEGDGPVNALDGALRRALAKSFPQLKKVTLTDYKVRILDGVAGTGAKTRVLITSTDGKREWGTVGVSENIIEASLQALVDSMEFALVRK
ncbi:MAG: citramalate synthase [Verrucomicrobia bacterium]|nr:citramalate synthase [Verrucomicrobiota bacterium]